MFPVKGGGVELSVSRAAAVHISGVRHCGSPWGCPVCSPVVRERRAGQIDRLVGKALQEGCEVRLVTATVQHRKSHTLKLSLGAVTDSWTAAFSGRAAQWPGYIGQVRNIDLTVGVENGWHPHIHAVLVFEPGTAEADIDAYLLARGVVYRRKLRDCGMSAAADRRGWHVTKVHSAPDLSSYLAKVEGGWGVGLELARGDIKSGKRGGRTIWQVLRSAAIDGDCDDRDLWQEHEVATKGRNLIVCSRKLGARFNAVELLGESDEDAATAAMDEAPVFVVLHSASAWATAVERGYAGRLLDEAVEQARRFGFLDPPT